MDQNETEKLRKAIAQRPEGQFHLSDLYGEEWDQICIGDKVKLGNAFQKAVASNEFENVEDTGEKHDGGRVYVKGGQD
ncbi:MAG: DUF1413 domain-containing protein [Rhizobiales bacterium]|nr:DUF1413 domain-containing protein [Hyphomicrobiales bacterium]|tara:strand:+ start:507 stop:740 length:234 start_codon:yes stop_codon:yes gene_type:complete